MNEKDDTVKVPMVFDPGLRERAAAPVLNNLSSEATKFETNLTLFSRTKIFLITSQDFTSQERQNESG